MFVCFQFPHIDKADQKFFSILSVLPAQFSVWLVSFPDSKLFYVFIHVSLLIVSINLHVIISTYEILNKTVM